MKIKKLLSIGVIFAFVVSAPITYYIPSLRTVLLLLLFTLVVFDIFENSIHLHTLVFILFIITMIFLSVLLSGQSINSALATLYFYVAIILGYYASQDYEIFLKLIKWILFLNLPLLIYEISTDNFVYGNNFGEQVKIEYASIISSVAGRAKGLFSYTKEAAGFIIFSSIALREDKKSNKYFVSTVALVSAILTGTRLAIIIVFLVLFVDLFLSLNLNRKRFWKTIKSVLVVLLVLFVIAGWYFYTHPEALLRLGRALYFEDSSNVDRLFYWKAHLDIFFEYGPINLLFGKLNYSNMVIGNGAESSYIALLTNGGIVAFLLYFIPLFVFSIKTITNFKKYYPFILLLIGFQLSRIGMGWSDGIVFWGMIFHMLNAEGRINACEKVKKRE